MLKSSYLSNPLTTMKVNIIVNNNGIWIKYYFYDYLKIDLHKSFVCLKYLWL